MKKKGQACDLRSGFIGPGFRTQVTQVATYRGLRAAL